MSKKITLNYSPISALFCWEVETHDTLWLTPFLGVEAELLLAGDGEHGGEVGGRRGGGEAPSDLGTEVAVRQGRNLQQVSLYLFLDSYHYCDEIRWLYKDKARVCTVWFKEAFQFSSLGFAGEIKTSGSPCTRCVATPLDLRPHLFTNLSQGSQIFVVRTCWFTFMLFLHLKHFV